MIGVEKPATPFAVTKLLWVYIKEHNLQNPDNKREIVCDDKLGAVFGGRKSVTMFEMAKYIQQHFLDDADSVQPLARVEHPPPSAPKEKKPKKKKAAKAQGEKRKREDKPREEWPFVSTQLAAVIGDDRVQDRFKITKAMWAYIREHDCQVHWRCIACRFVLWVQVCSIACFFFRRIPTTNDRSTATRN